MDNKKYAILILAAGDSKRLGRPKQLLVRNKTTLLNYVIGQALRVENTNVFVALGGNKLEIRTSILDDVALLDIPNWSEGMSTSIANSLRQIDLENYSGIILGVCDQPYISSDIFNKLIRELENGNGSIITSQYDKASGSPTLFSSKYFPDLMELKGDFGAKKIVKNNIDDVAYIRFPKGSIDIDTDHDLFHLSVFRKDN